jgi:hypothetical protein
MDISRMISASVFAASYFFSNNEVRFIFQNSIEASIMAPQPPCVMMAENTVEAIEVKVP